MPEFEVKVVSCRCGARVSDNGYGCAGLHLVACLLQKLLVVLVDGYDVSGMLYLDDVAGFVAPSVVYDSAVSNRIDCAAGRCGYVYVWVDYRVVSL